MKTILYTLCLACSSLSLFAQTPITLTRSDFPCPSLLNCGLPDSVLYTNVPVAGTSVDLTTTGANSVWNMTPLSSGTTVYQPFYPMSATPLVFQLVFLSCDYAQPLLGSNTVANLPVTDAYEYYNYAGTGSTRLEIKGFGAYVTLPGQTTAIPLPALYSSADVLYQFPIAYGHTDSSNSGFSVTLPLGGTIGDVTFKRSQKRVNEVDAWGTITTPAGSFDVLRVHSVMDRMDSLITALFPLGVPSNPVEFKWLGQGKKFPVFEVDGNLTGGNVTTTSIRYWGQELIPAGLAQHIPVSPLQLYPNPASDYCELEFTLESAGDLDICITSVTGNCTGHFHLAHADAGLHHEYLPVQQLPAGLYQVSVTSGTSTRYMRLEHK